MSLRPTEKGNEIPLQDFKNGEAIELDVVDAKGDGPEWEQLLRDAKASEEAEKNMPLMMAFRVYPKAVAWTFAVTLCFVM